MLILWIKSGRFSQSLGSVSSSRSLLALPFRQKHRPAGGPTPLLTRGPPFSWEGPVIRQSDARMREFCTNSQNPSLRTWFKKICPAWALSLMNLRSVRISIRRKNVSLNLNPQPPRPQQNRSSWLLRALEPADLRSLGSLGCRWL